MPVAMWNQRINKINFLFPRGWIYVAARCVQPERCSPPSNCVVVGARSRALHGENRQHPILPAVCVRVCAHAVSNRRIYCRLASQDKFQELQTHFDIACLAQKSNSIQTEQLTWIIYVYTIAISCGKAYWGLLCIALCLTASLPATATLAAESDERIRRTNNCGKCV